MASRRDATLAVSRGSHPAYGLSAPGYRQPSSCPKEPHKASLHWDEEPIMPRFNFFRFSDSYINVLLTFACQHRILLPDPDLPTMFINPVDPASATRLGRALLDLHAQTTFTRYCMHLEWVPELSLYTQQARRYVFRSDIRLRALGSHQSIVIIKATHTYERHARRSSAYDRSSAAIIIRALREGACFHLPAYEAAPALVGDAPEIDETG